MSNSNETQSEIIKDLEEQSGLVDEQPVEESQETKSEGLSEDNAKDEQPKITEDFAKEYGLPDWMVDKPMTDLGKSYKELNKKFTQTSQEFSQVRKDLESIKSQMIDDAGSKEEKKEVKDAFQEMPDPIDEPEEFREWIGETIQSARSEAKTEALKEIQKQYEPIQQEYNQKREEQVRKDIEGQTGESADEVLKAFGEANIKSQDDVEWYLQRPETLVAHAVAFHKARVFDSLQSSKSKGDREVKKSQKAHEIHNKKLNELNTNERKASDKPSIVSEIAESLEQQF